MVRFPFRLLLVLFVLLAGCGGGGSVVGGEETGSPGSTPVATTLPASSITPTSAILNGTVVQNGLQTQSWFEYGTDSTLATYTESARQDAGDGRTGPPGHAANMTWSGLATGTTYYFRFCAENGKGQFKGQISAFTTISPSSFRVVSTSPENNGTEIPPSGTIEITFSREVNPSTISNGITARSYLGGLPGTVSYDPSTKTATFTPGTPFAPLTEYTVTVGTSVRSANGEALSAPYVSRFTTVTAFWAYDIVSGRDYLIGASKVAEGAHCYIYLENGNAVSQSNIERIKNEFDSTIHPSTLGNFGSEPNPGADGLPKTFIVLLDIRDGNNPAAFVAGYFYSINEYSNVDSFPQGVHSNQKEVIFMDIYPGNPSSPSFGRILTHEYQHMVHWEQKTNRLGHSDDTWLDEAMSEIAPFYAGYGPDYTRVWIFEDGSNRSDSLTVWNQGFADYGVAYMWSQYMADRFPSGVFHDILAAPSTGIASVNDYLESAYPGATFSTVFRDWSIAVFSGNDIAWTDHPEWSYKNIHTGAGTYGGISLPGMFTPDNLNVFQLPSLAPWSVDFYWHTPQSADPEFTWNPGPPPTPQASFISMINDVPSLSFDMVPGQPYPYGSEAFVVLQNAGGGTTSGATSSNLSIRGSTNANRSPLEKLKAISESATSKKLREKSGEPVGICIHDSILEREKVIREKMREKQKEMQ